MIDEVKSGAQEMLAAGKEAVTARLASPVVGPFVVSWIICNYRFLLVLLSDADYRVKFAYFDRHFSPIADYLSGDGLLYPVIGASIYIFGAKYLAEIVNHWDNFMDRRRRFSDLKSKGKSPLTEAESFELRNELEEKANALRTSSQEVRKRSVLIAALKAALYEEQNSLRNFIISQEFALTPLSGTQRYALLRFNEGGQVVVRESASKVLLSAQSWDMRGKGLSLFDEDGGEVCEMRFEARKARFVVKLSQAESELALVGTVVDRL